MRKTDFIQQKTIDKITKTLLDSLGKANQFRIEKGVGQVADLWQESDGSETDFEVFCKTYFVADSAELDKLYSRLERNFEAISGTLHKADVLLKEPVQMTGIESSSVDLLFAGYDISAHVNEDMYGNKIEGTLQTIKPSIHIYENEAIELPRECKNYEIILDEESN